MGLQLQVQLAPKALNAFKFVEADIYICIAANPPGFPGNLPDFETCPGIPDLKKNSRILKFVQKKKKIGIISSTLSGIAVTSHTFALFVFYFLPRMILI